MKRKVELVDTVNAGFSAGNRPLQRQGVLTLARSIAPAADPAVVLASLAGAGGPGSPPSRAAAAPGPGGR